MSTIDKILKEIEKNQEESEIVPVPVKLELGTTFNKYKQRFFNAFNISVVLVVIFSVTLLVLYRNKIKQYYFVRSIISAVSINPISSLPAPLLQKVQTGIPSPQAILSKSAVVDPAALVRLENVIFDVDHSKTVIDFMVSREIYYYVERGQNSQQMKIILSNTTYDKPFVLDLTNTALKRFNTYKVSNNTEIEIDLMPDTQVIGLQFEHQPKTHLRLILLNTTIQAGTVNKTIIPLTQQQRSSQAYQEALYLLDQNSSDQAIVKLREAVKSAQEHPEVYEALITLLMQNNRLDEVDKVLNNAIKDFPEYTRFGQVKAYVLAQKGKTEQALQLLIKNMPDINQDPDYYAFVASLYQQQGQFILAAQLYNRLLKIQPRRSMWWVGLGIALDGAEKDAAAQEAYRRASIIGDLSPAVQTFVNGKIQ